MNIVIVGAGGLGRYVASVLAQDEHNVILVDNNPKKLEKAAWHIDVATRLGTATNWQLLDDILDLSPDFFIALTKNDEVNLVSSAMAKHLGYPRTIARIGDNRYLNRTRLDFSQIFEVDYFIGPELLVANDIFKYMISPGSLLVENFAHGAVQLRTLQVPENWKKSKIPLMRLNLPKGIIVGLIRRKARAGKGSNGYRIIFPHGNDHILPGDEITFIGETDTVAELHGFLGISLKPIQSCVIIGGSLTGLSLAKLLQKRNIDVRLIEKDYERCQFLAGDLPGITVMNYDGTDRGFLESEKIGQAEVFVSCTNSDETNLAIAMLGKNLGCGEILAMLSNPSYMPIAGRLGINHVVSPYISAADHILSQVLSGTVTSLVSLYDNQAEIVEVRVSAHSRIVGIPLSELGSVLPKNFLIAMIQNRGRIMVANGNRIISPGDTVIVITSPEHARELENIF